MPRSLVVLDALEAQPAFRAVDQAIALMRKHYGDQHDETKGLVEMRERLQSGQLRNKTLCPAGG